MKHPRGQCEVCKAEKIRYWMLRVREDGTKEGVWVGIGCEKRIGHENLLRLHRVKDK